MGERTRAAAAPLHARPANGIRLSHLRTLRRPARVAPRRPVRASRRIFRGPLPTRRRGTPLVERSAASVGSARTSLGCAGTARLTGNFDMTNWKQERSRVRSRTPLRALAGLVERRMRELGVNVYDVARRSGGAVSKSTVWNVARGKVRGVHRATVEGLARGLDLAPGAIEEAVLADRPHVARWRRRYVGLPAALWEAIEGEARRRRMSADEYLEAIVAGRAAPPAS